MSFLWTPHDRQRVFLERTEFEAFYGGAAGPGKTDALIMGALRYVGRPRYRALLLRRTFPRLTEILDRTREIYPLVVPGAEYRPTEHRWYFPAGSICQLGHMQHEHDKYNYRGQQYQYVAFDELTEFTLTQYLYLFSRTRSPHDKTIVPMVRSASNPGDIGHSWVKERFITIADPETIFVWTDKKTGRSLSRIFIPGLLEDNPYLFENDPDYEVRLRMLPEIDYQRLRYGIWDAFEGQVFGELNKEIHGYDPKKLEIPPEWHRFRSFDWGYATPAAVGWWAVDYDGRLYKYREWYIAKKDEQKIAYHGMRMSAAEIARGIKEREQGETVRPGPADPSIWSKRVRKDKTTGISVAEEMAREGIHWIQGDNDRILGKHQFHSRLRLDEEGMPWIYISNDCEHFWRTLPEMRESPTNPEDVDCFVKGTKIITPSGVRLIEEIKTGDLVYTPIGNRKVIKAGVSGKSERVIAVSLSNGETLKGTANHCVFVRNRGLVELQKLDKNDELEGIISNIKLIWRLRKLYIMVFFIAKAIAKVITGQMAHISKKVFWNCIGKFIKTIMVISPRGLISTTLITTATTIYQKTLLPYPKKHTLNTTSNLQIKNQQHMNGRKQKEGRLYLKKTQKRWFKIPQRENMRADVVVLLLKLNTLQRNIAIAVGICGATLEKYVPFVGKFILDAMVVTTQRKPVHIVAVGDYENEIVYKLTVEEAHLYYANGVLVTNTDQEDHIYDESRYFFMFRPLKTQLQAKQPPRGSFMDERNRYILAKKHAEKHGVSINRAYERIKRK